MLIRSAGTILLLALFAAPGGAQQTADPAEEKTSQTTHTNPFLKVHVVCGDYDMATVFMGSEINFWHLGYDRTFTDRVSFSYNEGGHMMHTRPSAHKALKNDVAKFITANSGAKSRAGTPL